MSIRNRWLQLSCFLIGYDYNLLTQCSELSKKAVRKYSSAMILVMLIWGFVGYSFSNRYLGINQALSSIGALIGIIVIIQIERQIILSTNPGWKVYTTRTIIAVAMALIGALIVDQIIFKNDLETFKKNTSEQRSISRSKTIDDQYSKNYENFKLQINQAQLNLLNLENQRKSIPSTLINRTNRTTVTQSEENTSIKSTITGAAPIVNPEYQQISTEIENTRKNLKEWNIELQNLNNKYKIEKTNLINKINQEPPGFIEELNYMFELIKSHGVVLSFWILWIIFLLGIELFILFSKASEIKTDYEKLIEFQTEIREERMKKILENNAKHLNT